MAEAGRGNEEAMATLIRRHQDLVFGTVYRMLSGQVADAEDIAQQVFIKVYRARRATGPMPNSPPGC